MELCIGLEYLLKQRDKKEKRDFAATAALCKNAGFSHVDYSGPYLLPDWEERAYEQRSILDDAGITVEQTHAPFNRYCAYSPEEFPVLYRRLFEISRIFGAKYVVVHADEYHVTDRYDEKEILDFTYDYLAPYVEYAAGHNMTVAVENVFEDRSGRHGIIDGKSRFTSRTEELIGVIERFHCPEVGCCFDFGHARCAVGDEGMPTMLEAVGKYLVCTHVHDNYYEKDLHLPPYLGNTDWETMMHLLKKIGYRGKFSFELVYGSLPDALLPDFLAFVHKTGEKLLRLP